MKYLEKEQAKENIDKQIKEWNDIKARIEKARLKAGITQEEAVKFVDELFFNEST